MIGLLSLCTPSNFRLMAGDNYPKGYIFLVLKFYFIFFLNIFSPTNPFYTYKKIILFKGETLLGTAYTLKVTLYK